MWSLKVPKVKYIFEKLETYDGINLNFTRASVSVNVGVFKNIIITFPITIIVRCTFAE